MSRRNREDGPPVYNQIAVLRAERNISRKQLAEAAGVHYQTIGYLERGSYSPSLQLALTLARYFGLPVEAVFSLDPFQPMSNVLFQRDTDGAADEELRDEQR